MRFVSWNQCGSQAANLGTEHATAYECAAAAWDNAACGSAIMFSPKMNAHWGCRCCRGNGGGGVAHKRWQLHRVVIASSNGSARAAWQRARQRTRSLSGERRSMIASRTKACRSAAVRQLQSLPAPTKPAAFIVVTLGNRDEDNARGARLRQFFHAWNVTCCLLYTSPSPRDA